MNFKHREKVRIKKGFHKGNIATILDERFCWPFKDYLIYFEFEGTEKMNYKGQHWEAKQWIAARYLEPVDLPKKGNVIQAQKRFKEK